ncbi:MAG: hypothetical protein AAGD10_14110 [Myxococcota bacterium]
MKNLRRVIRALELERARESEQFRAVDARRAELERELDRVDDGLRRLEASCRVEDLGVRVIADAAAKRLQEAQDELSSRLDHLDREEVEPARARLVEANVRVSTVELLVERRSEAAKKVQAQQQQQSLDEFGAQKYCASNRIVSN